MEVKTRVYTAQSKKVWIVVLVFALVVLAIGVYLGFIKSNGYVRTTGTIESFRAEESYDSDMGYVTYYYPTVRYIVDGKAYTGELDISSSPGNIGKEVKVQYDPENPSKVNSYSPGIVLYILALGVVLAAVSLFQLLRKK